jgi:hypothetical protein
MVAPAEMAFFAESAARYLGKEGAIVDLGCWLGSTSVALARGILDQEGANSAEKVLGFDRFIWEEWMSHELAQSPYKPGDSFLPQARRIVTEFGGGIVELHQVNLEDYQWTGEPIKILLLDAMKSEAIAKQISCTFYPSLKSGSLLIHQDFKHYYTSWIHLLQYRLRQHFRLYQNVLRTATVAFEVLTPMSTETVAAATQFEPTSDEEIDAAFRHSFGQVGPAEGVNVAAAHVMHYLHLRRKVRGSEILEMYCSLGLTEQGEFPKLLSYFHELE